MNRLSNRGNVEDIRCSMQHYLPSTEELFEEIEYEKSTRNRSTVIKLYEVAIRKNQKAGK